MKNKNFDIIGDIHGHADALSQLLEKLAYSKDSDGVYFHPSRQVIFLGDFIDRIPNQARVINIVKSMVEKKYALAIMGNHELNAIHFHTRHSNTNKPLREHSEKNIGQHQAFLDDYPFESEKTKPIIEWFKTLPIFLELDDFRVIHACWNDCKISEIKKIFKNGDNVLTEEQLSNAANKGKNEYSILETLLKGIELKLPGSAYYLDQEKNKRYDIRIKWWDNTATTYHDYAVVQDEKTRRIIPKTNLPDDFKKPIYTDNNPVFFGHYWFSGIKPEIINKHIACLDFSSGNGQKLVAYQWNEHDKFLSNDNFIFVDASLISK